MKAKLAERVEVAAGVWLVKLTTEEEINFRAGQFFQLVINQPEPDSRGNARYFGFINSPTLDMTAEMVTRAGPSPFKRYLLTTALGTEMEIGKIGGEMTLPADVNSPLVIVTEDIGVAPIVSVLRFVDEKSLPYRITLVYSKPTVFLGELTEIAKRRPNVDLVTVMEGEEIRNYIPKPENQLFYVTGLPQFAVGTVKLLRECGVAPKQTKFEVFTGY